MDKDNTNSPYVTDINAGETSSDSNPKPVTWTGPEFISYDKNTSWYFLLLVGCVAISGIVYILLKDLITVAVVVVAFLVTGIYGARKPRNITYTVDSGGVQIGDKRYNYSDYRHVTVSKENANTSITMFPLKRFAFSVFISVNPENEAAVLGLMANSLPIERHNPDFIDRLMARIRF